MADKYQVSVTIGVRQANMGDGSFTASDSFIIEAEGFGELMGILATVHDTADQLRARASGPQDKRR